MKRRLPLFVLTTTLFMVIVVGGAAAETREDNFLRDAELVLKLGERSADLRTRVLAFAADHATTERITGVEHDRIDRAIREYGAIRTRLWDVVERTRQQTGMGEGHRPLMSWVHSVITWFKGNEHLNADGKDERIQALLVAVGAGTIMIENAACVIEHLAGTIFEKRADRPVNLSGDEELLDLKLDMVIDDLFHSVLQEYHSVSNRDAYTEVVAYLLENQERIRELSGEGPDGVLVRRLNELVFASAAGLDFFANGSLLDDYSSKLQALGAKLVERLEADMNALSKVFGNAVGSIHLGTATITGKKRKRIAKRLLEILEPGDLLLDKTSFAMTDRLIPGHFGHVAIWLGRPDQLEDLGLFDPEFNTFGDSLRNATEWRDKLMEGKCVLEALRPGVVINTLEHFLNVDEVLVLRLKPDFIGNDEKSRHLLRKLIVCRGMHHLGQRYDFNFDINTANTIVCSELAYQAYPQTVAWPLTKTAGRWTISPDQVAVMAGPGEAFPLEIVHYVRSVWRDGEIIDHEALDGLPIGGSDLYELYWRTLLEEFPLPQVPDFAGNEALTSWAQAVNELATVYEIRAAK